VVGSCILQGLADVVAGEVVLGRELQGMGSLGRADSEQWEGSLVLWVLLWGGTLGVCHGVGRRCE